MKMHYIMKKIRKIAGFKGFFHYIIASLFAQKTTVSEDVAKQMGM